MTIDKNGNKIKLKSGGWKSRKINTTDWDKRENVEIWRQWYAQVVNKHLKLNGASQRIDHRSFKRQGLEKKPTERLHRKVYEKEKQGVKTPQGDRNRQIMEDNRQREQIKQELEKLRRDRYLAELEQVEEQRAEPHHEINFEDRYRRPQQPSYSERHPQATAHYKPAKDDNTNFEDRYKTRKQIPVPETKTPYEAKFEDKRKQAEISKESMEYEERKRQRKYEPVPQKTIHQEYAVRKFEERYNQPSHHKNQHREHTPELQPEPHHEVDFKDRYKRPKRPSELEKNKDDDKTHDR